MPINLKNELVILCEGSADQSFLKALMADRGGYPPVDFLDPREHYGATNFCRVLNALKGNPRAFAGLKGVLIVADSHAVPSRTLDNIRRQIRQSGGYPVPSGTIDAGIGLEIAPRTADHPATAVMLLPDERTPGGLETLLVSAIQQRRMWAAHCVDIFLSCDRSRANLLSVEKLGKAKYACLVAMLCRDDPSRSASYAFRNPPAVPIKSSQFHFVARRLRSFCEAVLR